MSDSVVWHKCTEGLPPDEWCEAWLWVPEQQHVFGPFIHEAKRPGWFYTELPKSAHLYREDGPVTHWAYCKRPDPPEVQRA